MRKASRLTAAIALALLCLPGNCLRTEVSDAMPKQIALEQLAGASEVATPGWAIEGVWRYSSPQATRNFGGYSALLPLGGNRLRAFSDRGTRFTFHEPDDPRESPETRVVAFQLVDKRYSNELWDIEAATRGGLGGDYWIAFENYHAIHRYSVASERKGVRVLEDDYDWYTNAGAEALVRLSDGRFVAAIEGREEALVFDGDPVEGAAAQLITLEPPRAGFVATDMAQLPDGRLLLLMRDVVWKGWSWASWPPFSSFIAIADPPLGREGEVWTAQIALDLEGVVPAENYEGLTLREEEDGSVAVWLIADDNLSAFQRTLLVKLRFDPRVAGS